MKSLIYKDEVLDTLQTCLDTDVIPYGKGKNYIRYEQAVYEINKLQNKSELFGFSEQPERKKGKWIFDGDCFICSECKSAFNWWARSQCSNYCPNCGADIMSERRR